MEKTNYQLSVDETIKKFDTDKKLGLTNEEVLKRRELNGFNELDKAKKRNILLKFIDQLKDFMILILFAASLISIFTGDIPEGILIISIVVINAILGVFQEAKAEKALDSIQKLSSPHIIVIRDGREVNIDVKDLVIGDLVVLTAGDFMPADLRIIESVNIKVDESALTGEAVPVDKHHDVIESDNTPLGDRLNLGFMGTVITYGRGYGIVTSIGMNTEIGKIAKMLQETESEPTPLQKSINQLGKILAIIALAITGLIFAIDVIENIIINGSVSFDSIKDSFTFAVALAVAAIPEGLPAIITVVLSLGMTNLVKQKAIMRTLPSVETLGSTDIICSDKTGTLTQNVMTVQKVYVGNKLYDTNDDLKVNKDIEVLIKYGILASDVKVVKENDTFVKFGDPTELALIDLGIKYNYNPIEVNNNFERIFEYPFDSKRKLMSTINIIDGKTYLLTKGAPDVLLNKSNNSSNDVLKANEEMADSALRVLAIGYKELDSSVDYKNMTAEEIENNLTFLGLVGMIDPERPEVKDAIITCKKAGIKTIMITGDHKNTAVAIAKNIGILEDDSIAITGSELDKLSDEEFMEKLEHIRVYARVSPENKVRIVKAWRSKNMVVAMTGDGVNDAPSIKQADIGIAMGITGTEVAKGAADMILTDDNFATIVNAVGEGRTIFANIKKAIHYLLSCNVGEIFTMLLGVTIGLLIFKDSSWDTHVLTAVQILWVNLVTDSLMAIALGLEKREPNVMDQQPRDNEKSIFADGLGFKIAWQGFTIGVITFIAFAIGWYFPGTANKVVSARTMAFMVLAISQLFHAFNARSEKYSIFSLKQNKMLIYAFIVSFSLQLAVVLIPGTQKLFEVTFPTFIQWLVIFGLSLVPVLIVETQKFVRNLKKK